MSDIAEKILRKIVTQGHGIGSYMWCSGDRFGIETGIDLTDEEGKYMYALMEETSDEA